jgi:ferredoxin-nitrite reductase
MSSNAISNSAEFTTAQKEYLQGFFAGVTQRGFKVPFVGHTADGRITADPGSHLHNQASISAEPKWFDTPVSDLSREEQWKYEQNPLEIWDKVLEYSNQDRCPTEDDRFRLKYHGLF